MLFERRMNVSGLLQKFPLIANSPLKHGKLTSKHNEIDIFTCKRYLLQCKDMIFLSKRNPGNSL